METAISLLLNFDPVNFLVILFLAFKFSGRIKAIELKQELFAAILRKSGFVVPLLLCCLVCVGCGSVDSMTPATVADLAAVKSELADKIEETRTTVSIGLNESLPGSHVARLASAQADDKINRSVDSSVKSYTEIALAVVGLFGGGGLLFRGRQREQKFKKIIHRVAGQNPADAHKSVSEEILNV